MSFYSLITGDVVNMGTFVTDALFAVCVVLLLGRLELRVRAVAMRAAEAVGLFLLGCSLDVLCGCFGVSGYPGPTFPSLLCILVVYAALQSSLSAIDRIARVVTFMSLFVLIVVVVRTILPTMTELRNYWFGYSVPSFVSYVCMVVSVVCIRRFSVEGFGFVPKSHLLLIVAIDVLGMIAGQEFLALHDTYDFLDVIPSSGSFLVGLSRNISKLNLVVCMSFIVLILLAYVMFYQLAKEHERRAELLVTKKSDIDSASMADVTRQTYEQLREMRHEIKNHDAYLAALLEAEDFDRMREFFSTHMATNAEVMHYVSSGNPIVDAVVNAKAAQARAQGVEIETVLAVPEELPFDEDDVFRLLANLLDNAIEGACSCGLEGSSVKLKILPEAGYYFVKVENPCDPKTVRRGRSGELLTSKKDGDIHGYGTKVILHIAEKYQGTASFSLEGTTFTASVMLARHVLGRKGAPAA